MNYQCSIPGKLYVAGEYGVVKGYHAIILPTKLHIHFDIRDHDTLMISSNQWDSPIVYTEEMLKCEAIWEKALKTTYRYLKELHIQIKTTSIIINSELDQLDHKYGLGSSGAIVIGLIQSVLVFHDINLSSLQLYKLGVIALKDDRDVSSYGDLACSAFDAPILYKKDITVDLNLPIHELVQMDWDELQIEVLQAQFDMMVIHTNESASSSKLVKALNEHVSKEEQLAIFSDIDPLVLSFLNEIMHDDKIKAFTMIKQIETKMKTLDERIGNLMYSNNINKVFEFAKRHGVTYKISGAGGGDNILLFLNSKKEYNDINKALPKPFINITSFIKGVIYE
ncbi:MAG: hypothetical protein ACO3MF_01780 [Acholeplasmataceae bacterium]